MGDLGCDQPIFDEGVPNWNHGFGTDEQAGYFGFGSRGHDKLDDLGNIQYWAVAGGDGSIFIKNDVRARVASRLADIEVCSIRVSYKYHAIIAEQDAVGGVSGDVIQGVGL